MCGRAACSLNPETLCRACEYKDKVGKRRRPTWRTKDEMKFVPSSNLGPRDLLPCIVAGTHFNSEEERVFSSMIWGIIPHWHKGDYRKHTLSTHNARLENIKNSKLYKPSLIKGRRCIVVCEGYYEWKAGKTKNDTKQPYFIYAAQDKSFRPGEESGCKEFKLLKLAGLFDTFKTAEGKIIHSCTIITRESNSVISWLHHRVPIILNTEEDSRDWLNGKILMSEAIDRLNALTLSKDSLSWYTVSTRVNNVLDKSEDCTKETKPIEVKKSGPTGCMASWLKRGSAESAKRKSTSNDEAHGKESKEEDEKPKKNSKME